MTIGLEEEEEEDDDENRIFEKKNSCHILIS
jgi:hypothetical protein